MYDLSFRYYLASVDNNTGSVDNEFSVKLFRSSNDEELETLYIQQPNSNDFTATWDPISVSDLNLDAYIGQTVYLQFYGNDGGQGDVIEFGVDDISLDFTSSSLNPTGALADGEVEDYAISIKNEVTGTGSSEVIDASFSDPTTPGDDLIIGGAGQDTLTGGDGDDCFHFNRTSDGIDVITDFKDNGDADKIDLSDLLATGGELEGIPNPFGTYVEALVIGSSGTLIQIDFEDSNNDLLKKNIVYLDGYTTAMTADDFIF